jgi:hypothetical protein
MPKLTAQLVERIKPDPTRRVEIPDPVLPGFYLIVQPSGAKSWAVRYRHSGRTRKLTLATVARLPLGEARERAREALEIVSAGRDPAFERKQARSGDHDLIRNVVQSFVERHVRANLKARSAEEVERLFKLHVLPKWSNRRIQDLGRRDVVELLDGINDRGTPVAANRALAAISKLFNWSIERGIVETSPCTQVKRPSVETSRDRVLSDEELGLAWCAAEQLAIPSA